jgi:Tfp pilus assembly protein PilP
MTNQQKGFVLVGLLLAWGSVTAYQMSEFSESSSTNLPTARPLTQSSLPSVKDLSLEKSFPNARKMATFSQPRNIFAPFVSHKVATKQPVATIQSPRPLVAQPKPVPPPGPTAAELATQRARQQLNRFRFLGYLTKGGESQAFLTNGQAIYIVKQGEMLDGQIQVNKIETESIILSTQIHETGSHVQATIPLTPDSSS